jgi:hypothetical protein
VKTLYAAALTAAVAGSLLVGPPAQADIPYKYRNCTNLQKTYPHGVGKRDAVDQTSGTPVTTFKKSNKLYNAANRANGRLDGDDDGIACEKA